MNLREYTALIQLYQACTDNAVRARAVVLVPELAEWSEAQATADPARRWRLTAMDGARQLGHRTVVSGAADIRAHRDEYRATFDLATDVWVKAEPI